MGPAAEVFLTVLIPILIGIGLLAYFGKPLWKRIGRFFQAWYLQDKQREQIQKEIEEQKKTEERVQERLRQQAQLEVKTWGTVNEDIKMKQTENEAQIVNERKDADNPQTYQNNG